MWPDTWLSDRSGPPAPVAEVRWRTRTLLGRKPVRARGPVASQRTGELFWYRHLLPASGGAVAAIHPGNPQITAA